MKHFYPILLYIMLVSCIEGSPSKYSRYKGFPTEKNLKAEVLSLDTALFRYPFRITIKDSFALIMDLHNANNYFHLFHYPEMDHIVSFGHRGDSPEDMLSAETFEFQSLDSIWALDANKMQITRWKITNQNYLVTKEESINLDNRMIRALDFDRINSDFIIPDYLGENRFNRTDGTGNLLRSEGKIPSEQFFPVNSSSALAQAWRSFIDYNPDNGVLAIVTQLGEVLEVYNMIDKTHKVLYGPNGEPDFEISDGNGIPTGIMGFSDVDVTDKYIYAVFHGRSFCEIAKQVRKGIKGQDGGKYIYVFSLTGEPVCCYTLDRYIYGIDVNEEKGIITAVDVNSDEPIVEFKI